jgi:sigma-B regulation protein RsbU (phosphoserine phosphatase)
VSAPEPASHLARLEAENIRLRRAVEELSVLNDVATAIASASSLEAIVDLVVQKCVKHLAVDQGAVLMFGTKDGAAALHTMVRKVQTDLRRDPYRLSEQVVGWMLKDQEPLVINDVATDERFREPTQQAGGVVTSLMCVPLRLKGRMIGVLSVFNKKGSGFTESDQRLGTIIAAQSAQVIEHARLVEEEKALQVMQRELEMAHEIQRNLLPKTVPDLPGYDLAAKTVPARNVGGDYYDFLPSGDDHLALVLGDVSGKSMPAALLMANVQATIRGQTLLNPAAGDCMTRSNRLLYDSTDSDKFVTFFYAVLDPARHELRYSNAGHNPPMLLSKGGEPRLLETGGPVLGVVPSFTFEEATVTIDPGDLLLIYSDGFTEAMDRRFEEFGEDRLLEATRAAWDLPAAGIVESIFDAVNKHAGDAPQTDDMTLMVLRYSGPAT